MFITDKQRKTFGSTSYLELQYCIHKGASVKNLFAKNTVEHWRDDSIYISVDGMHLFYSEYGEIFGKSNYKVGLKNIDMFGINYYNATQTRSIINKIEEQKPCDYKILLDWLKCAQADNGFYILGL